MASPLSVLKTHRWCNYYISIEVKSLSQRVDEKIFNFDENEYQKLARSFEFMCNKEII